MVHALTLVMVLLFLAPLAASVPLATLAAILFVVAYNMSEGRQFARMVRRAPRADVAILLITFTLTVLTDLVVAVNIGVILAMLQFLRRMSASVEVARQDAVDVELELGDAGAGSATRMPPGVLVYVIDGPFFFGAVEACERALVQTHTEPRVLLIRLGRVPFMDMTGLQTLEAVIVTLQKRGVAVVLAEANERVREKLARAGVLAALGEGNYVDSLAQAVQRCSELAGEGNAPR
ncbi:sulfate permease [compost metagenome]